MWIERLNARWLWVACGVLLALLLLIAVLQYRWINQISQADRRQREELLARTVGDFRRDFAETIYEPLPTFHRAIDPGGLPIDYEKTLADMISAWQDTTNRPQLLRAVSFCVQAEDGQVIFKRRQIAAAQFSVNAWPTELAHYRDLLEGGRPQHLAMAGQAGIGPPWFVRGFANEMVAGRPVIVFPLLAGTNTPAAENHAHPFAARRPGLKGWGFLELDAEYLQTQLLPELIDRHFNQNGLDRYQLAVVTGQPMRILLQSDANMPAHSFHSADARTTLFGSRQQTVPELPGLGHIGAGRPPGRHGPPDPPARPSPDLLNEVPQPDAWQLVVRYRSGSLALVVEHTRRRNLALSLGALLILAGSIALLGVATQRARSLAAQQMEFVAGVSHELRTPLAVIQSTSFNLARGTVTDPNRVQQYGVAIQTEARRLGAQMEQMLSFAGIQSGRKLYDLRALNVGEIIHQAMAEFLPALNEQGWQVETRIADDLPPVVADAQALESAIKNLIQNAMKYAAEGKWLRIGAEADQRGQVALTVADHGAGIDPADLPHIFEPFYRGKKILASTISGAGLGLSLVERHLRAMGGRVTVTSSAQTGTTFTLHMPAKKPVEP